MNNIIKTKFFLAIGILLILVSIGGFLQGDILIATIIFLMGFFLSYKNWSWQTKNINPIKGEDLLRKFPKKKLEIQKQIEETPEEKAKRLVNDYIRIGSGESEGHYLDLADGEFSIDITNKGILNTLYGSESELIEKVIKAKFNVRKAVDDIIEEFEVEEEAEKIKERSRKLKIREKAENSLFGKIKTKRIELNTEEKEAIFSKFNNKCAICSKVEGLHIHHKDKNPRNNRIDNLIVLCGVCHKKIHMRVR